MEQNNKIILFQSRQIRRVWHNEEWFYSLVDIVGALTESANPTDYLKKLRKRDEELGTYLGTNCPQVDMLTETGKKRKTLAGNTQDVFRLEQVRRSWRMSDGTCYNCSEIPNSSNRRFLFDRILSLSISLLFIIIYPN